MPSLPLTVGQTIHIQTIENGTGKVIYHPGRIIQITQDQIGVAGVKGLKIYLSRLAMERRGFAFSGHFDGIFFRDLPEHPDFTTEEPRVVLGLPLMYSRETLHRIYTALARDYHPDLGGKVLAWTRLRSAYVRINQDRLHLTDAKFATVHHGAMKSIPRPKAEDHLGD
jgi:hypothetical protein